FLQKDHQLLPAWSGVCTCLWHSGSLGQNLSQGDWRWVQIPRLLLFHRSSARKCPGFRRGRFDSGDGGGLRAGAGTDRQASPSSGTAGIFTSVAGPDFPPFSWWGNRIMTVPDRLDRPSLGGV